MTFCEVHTNITSTSSLPYGDRFIFEYNFVLFRFFINKFSFLGGFVGYLSLLTNSYFYISKCESVSNIFSSPSWSYSGNYV
jgi:hypothetical protein